MINMGVSNQFNACKYYQFDDPTLNTFDPRMLQLHRGRLEREKVVEVRPLKEILGQNLKVGQKIDLMNIDAEGLDLEVLTSNDWDRFAPEVIIIEDHQFNPDRPDNSEIVKFLKMRGYKISSYCHISLIMVKK